MDATQTAAAAATEGRADPVSWPDSGSPTWSSIRSNITRPETFHDQPSLTLGQHLPALSLPLKRRIYETDGFAGTMAPPRRRRMEDHPSGSATDYAPTVAGAVPQSAAWRPAQMPPSAMHEIQTPSLTSPSAAPWYAMAPSGSSRRNMSPPRVPSRIYSGQLTPQHPTAAASPAEFTLWPHPPPPSSHALEAVPAGSADGPVWVIPPDQVFESSGCTYNATAPVGVAGLSRHRIVQGEYDRSGEMVHEPPGPLALAVSHQAPIANAVWDPPSSIEPNPWSAAVTQDRIPEPSVPGHPLLGPTTVGLPPEQVVPKPLLYRSYTRN
ncbi:hypothetical protein BDV37DRAFT_290038 [Aspergillus pseudonomiae]|uniref:Uncharacterized protein n=1 Tax=Aspergillus pseudonomiae TaxID=1506151 RepID=A0A5N7CRC3_9EURO|nr:uncharacterized protein BDV37DRAFT_290038 [Aspergillus pseudonomiae]KAE8396751.1 hypothetical protein BDV37DRAFT_290038 [Aspergillus pseudonomiae]